MSTHRRSYTRLAVPGGCYFFTLVTFERRPILTTEAARHSLRLALQDTRAKYPFELRAICLLPDHLHCIWRLPDGDAGFARRWAMIKGAFSRSVILNRGFGRNCNVSRGRKGEAEIWQRRYWEHWLRDEEDLRRHLDYTHYNPVKHGYVEKPGDWRWSSFRRYVKKGWYDGNWGESEPRGLGDIGETGE